MRVTNNKKHILELISKVGKEVGLNSIFDSMDQIMTMTRRDGQELLAVAMSPTTGELDLPTQRETSEIIDSMMIPYGGGAVDHSQYQEIRTTMVKTQAFSIEMEYAGADRSCQGATRKLTVITARPLINGGDAFIEVRPDVYKSLAAENPGSLFFANTANKFKAEERGKQFGRFNAPSSVRKTTDRQNLGQQIGKGNKCNKCQVSTNRGQDNGSW